MANTNARRPGPQSGRGDFTGRLKEVQAAEHEDAVNERRDEIGLLAATRASIRDEAVIDLSDPSRPVVDGTDVAVDRAAREPGILKEEVVPPEGTRIGSTGSLPVYELPEEKPRAALAPNEGEIDPTVLDEPVIIKMLFDAEDVTIGYNNTYTLNEGYRYKLPRWVAAHLEEKGMCIVLSLDPA